MSDSGSVRITGTLIAMKFHELKAKYPDKDRVPWHQVPDGELRADLIVARRFREPRTNTPESCIGGVIEGWLSQALRARTPGLG